MTAPLRDIDLGHEGLTGRYTKFMAQLGRSLANIIIAAGAWIAVLKIAPGQDFSLSGFNVIMAVKLALLLWSIKIVITAGLAAWNGARWLGLEARGMQWAPVNGEPHRVLLYRAGDGTLRADPATAAQRLKDDADGRRYRGRAMIHDGAWLIVLGTVYHFLAQIYAVLFRFATSGQQLLLDRYDALQIIQWGFLFLVIVPFAVGLFMVLLESLIHALGAQFIPGAKVRG